MGVISHEVRTCGSVCGHTKPVSWFLMCTKGRGRGDDGFFCAPVRDVGTRGTPVADAPMGATTTTTTTMTWEELRKEARRCESACERELGELSAMGAYAQSDSEDATTAFGGRCDFE